MLAWNKNLDIAIWGTGYYGMKIYYKYRHIFNIKYFIDNYPKEDKIDDIPVILPEGILNEKIIIAVEDDEEICRQCQSLGKQFYYDYLPYNFIEYTEIDIIQLYEYVGKKYVQNVFFEFTKEKKLVIIIGNCQTEYIRKYMCQSKKFTSDYLFVKIPMIHLLSRSDEFILKENSDIFKKCDLCITQIISDDNGFSSFLSTSNVYKLLGKNTKIVKIPVLYFDIYFPQTIHQKKTIDSLRKVGILSFPYGDCILDDLSQRYCSNEIVEIVKDENFFSKEFLNRFFEERIESLRKKEEKCDIKILDYILKNYKKELLFYSKNHPCNKVIGEFVKRILEYLGYSDFIASPTLMEEMDSWQEILYPAVIKGYGLQFNKNIYKDLALDNECSFEEIVKYYLSYVHDKI